MNESRSPGSGSVASGRPPDHSPLELFPTIVVL